MDVTALRNCGLLFLAGGAGALARYGVSELANTLVGRQYPLGSNKPSKRRKCHQRRPCSKGNMGPPGVRRLQRRNKQTMACRGGRQRMRRGHDPAFAVSAQTADVTGHRSKADPKAEARDCKARMPAIAALAFSCRERTRPGCGTYVSVLPAESCRCKAGDGRGGVRYGAPACDHDGG